MHEEDDYEELTWVRAAAPQQRGLSQKADTGFRLANCLFCHEEQGRVQHPQVGTRGQAYG